MRTGAHSGAVCLVTVLAIFWTGAASADRAALQRQTGPFDRFMAMVDRASASNLDDPQILGDTLAGLRRVAPEPVAQGYMARLILSGANDRSLIAAVDREAQRMGADSFVSEVNRNASYARNLPGTDAAIAQMESFARSTQARLAAATERFRQASTRYRQRDLESNRAAALDALTRGLRALLDALPTVSFLPTAYAQGSELDLLWRDFGYPVYAAVLTACDRCRSEAALLQKFGELYLSGGDNVDLLGLCLNQASAELGECLDAADNPWDTAMCGAMYPDIVRICYCIVGSPDPLTSGLCAPFNWESFGKAFEVDWEAIFGLVGR